ncbi:MAG: helix-turn-helix transcriptional regulator [Candidatus Moduliflexus flocculans]|nr:helix-turn-helix transcriptional regulator [Candidatus Moduliflexus flocculans]
MTQEELARRLRVTRQTIISLEKNKHVPSLEMGFKVARLFQEGGRRGGLRVRGGVSGSARFPERRRGRCSPGFVAPGSAPGAEGGPEGAHRRGERRRLRAFESRRRLRLGPPRPRPSRGCRSPPLRDRTMPRSRSGHAPSSLSQAREARPTPGWDSAAILSISSSTMLSHVPPQNEYVRVSRTQEASAYWPIWPDESPPKIPGGQLHLRVPLRPGQAGNAAGNPRPRGSGERPGATRACPGGASGMPRR